MTTTIELLKIARDAVNSAEITEIYIGDNALYSAEAHLTDLEEHVAHLRRDLDDAIKADSQVKRAWATQNGWKPTSSR